MADGDGRFAITDLPRGWAIVTAEHEAGRATKRLHLESHRLDQPLTLVLAGGEILAGLVTGRDGVGIEGAKVMPLSRDGDQDFLYQIEARAVLADEAGRFRAENLGPGSWTLHVSAAGFGSVISEPFPTGVENIRIVLGGGAELECQVLRQEDGSPVEGITVLLAYEAQRLAPLRATSETGGVARFLDVGRGAFEVYVEDRRYALSSDRPRIEIDPGRKPDPVMVRVSEGGRIQGRVLEGNSSTGIADVVVRASNQTHGVFYSDATTADGTYELGGLPGGEYRIGPQDQLPGYSQDTARRLRRAIDIKPGDRLEGVDFVVTPGGALAGVVVDTSGTPVANAMVRARNDVGTQNLAECYTGADGRFAFGDYPSGESVNLSAETQTLKSGFEGPFLAGMPGSTEIELVLALDCSGIIAGRVTNAHGEPFECQIQAQSSDADLAFPVDPPHARTDAYGNFVLHDVCAGTYTLVIVPPRNSRSEAQIVRLLPGAKLSGLELRYEEGELFEIAGTVLDQDEYPVAGARIRAAIAETDPDPTSQETSDEAGRFLFSGLPEGTYLLQANASGYENIAIAVANTGDTDVEIHLAAPPQAFGRVMDAQGQPVTRFSITARPANNPDFTPRTQAISNEDGRFSLELPQRGQWLLGIGALGFTSVDLEWDASMGDMEQPEIEVTLLAAPPVEE